MTTRALLWNSSCRGGALGMLTGIVIGGTYGAVIGTLALCCNSNWMLLGFGAGGYVGTILGTLHGALIGSSGGLLFGFFAPRYFQSQIASRRSWKKIRVASVLFGAMGGALLLSHSLVSFNLRLDHFQILAWFAFHTLISVSAAMFISQRLTRWYENEIKKQPI